MALTSLPVILYVIPAVMLLTALTPPRRKAAVLGLGGLAYEYFTAGAAGLSLTVLSVCGAWFTLRIMPVRSKPTVLRRGIFFGILWQCGVLLTAKLAAQLSAADMLPLLCCTMLGSECILLLAKGSMHVPPLLSYIGGACAMPHLWAGPVLDFSALRDLTEQRSVTAERLGKGASRCITGLFQMVLLAAPLQTLLTEIGSYTDTLSLFDAWLLLLIRFCTVCHWLHGALRLGEGLTLMLGYPIPDTAGYTTGAVSLSEFWERFYGSGKAWAERNLLGDHPDPVQYFLRTSFLLAALGWLLGSGWCGVLCGIVSALLLTAGSLPGVRAHMEVLPRLLRRFGTALLVLLTCGMMFCRSLPELLSLHRALFGANGTPLSSTVGYLCGTHALPLLLAIVMLYPAVPALQKKAAQYKPAKRILAVCIPVTQLGILLCCMAELLSQYLRG